MLSVNREAVRAAGALAVLLIDTIVNNLNNAWQVSPPIIINILILLQCLFRIPHKHLIPLQFLEPVVDLIAVLTLLEDGVELEIERFSRDVLSLGEGLVLLLELTQLLIFEGLGLQVAHSLFESI